MWCRGFLPTQPQRQQRTNFEYHCHVFEFLHDLHEQHMVLLEPIGHFDRPFFLFFFLASVSVCGADICRSSCERDGDHDIDLELLSSCYCCSWSLADAARGELLRTGRPTLTVRFMLVGILTFKPFTQFKRLHLRDSIAKWCKHWRSTCFNTSYCRFGGRSCLVRIADPKLTPGFQFLLKITELY